jgi:hypothetical protein
MARSFLLTFLALLGVAQFIVAISLFSSLELARSPTRCNHQSNELLLQFEHLGKMRWREEQLRLGYMEYRFRSLNPSIF